ncbi:hypothetical protein N7E81_10160 [Reichenbachiella carrageenanivorans]|uniref:Uncharacterized protein n=1 Tax=Reichenbachiella carrageenanivorans TaxID=2979869 RepID=A0ABY6CUY1_9BACT|nr:hypothetical protein [Reichenbachiella carrageenanivorans]UXX77732.1 hypothetical protein N7E81_10160 [Reichenbachiella carrageenanivorans]
MAIEIKELKVIMQVKDPHSSTGAKVEFEKNMEQRIVEESVRKSVEIVTKKLERLFER